MGLVVFGLLVFSMFVLVLPSPRVSAQTEYVTTTPGNINLGMNTTIAVTSPAAGSYVLAVEKPSGVVLQLNETFTSVGQVQNAVFGLSGSGFKSLADQPSNIQTRVPSSAVVTKDCDHQTELGAP